MDDIEKHVRSCRGTQNTLLSEHERLNTLKKFMYGPKTMLPLIRTEYKTQKLKICVKLSINCHKSMGNLFVLNFACGLNIKNPFKEEFYAQYGSNSKISNEIMQLGPNDSVQIYRPFFGFSLNIYSQRIFRALKFRIIFCHLTNVGLIDNLKLN